MKSSRPPATLRTLLFGVIGLTLLLTVSASASAATNVSWATGNPLLVKRCFHTGTLLADGRLLVTGGETNGSILLLTPSAEIYNPATGNWIRTGSLHTARFRHAAVRLADGTVLVTGGNDASENTLASVERYHPDTGAFTPAANMTTPRVYHTATLLADGRVLAVGGNLPNTQITTAEVYDPATDSWTPTPNLAGPHIFFTATRLQNGQVLVAGGGTPVDPFITQQAELYDPAANTWSVTGSLSKARERHTATLLADGRVLVAGGEGPTSNGTISLSSCELYDPETGKWTVTHSMNVGRQDHEATLLADGEVLVVAGVGGPWQQTILKSTEVYDPSRGRWSVTGELVLAVAGETATLLPDGRVLVTGGYNRSSVVTNMVQVGTPALGE